LLTGNCRRPRWPQGGRGLREPPGCGTRRENTRSRRSRSFSPSPVTRSRYLAAPTECLTSIRRDPARWRRAIGDLNRFPNSQLKHPGRKARGGSVDRDLRPGPARDDDGLGTLSDRVEPPAYRVGAASSVVGQRAVRKPGKRDRAQRVVPEIIDNS